MLGEFGRTPWYNKDAGRDHWTEAFPALFAGAGVQGGLVLGQTDRIAAYPTTRSFRRPTWVPPCITPWASTPPPKSSTSRVGRCS